MKTKKDKLKQENQVEVNFHERNLIYDEFKKLIEYIAVVELEMEPHKFSQDSISCELITDFIEFTKELYENEFQK